MIKDLVRAGVILAIGAVIYRAGQKDGFEKGVEKTVARFDSRRKHRHDSNKEDSD